MKKVLMILLSIVILFTLTECESSENSRLGIFESLKKEKIISDSMELYDIESYSNWALEWCETTNYYIYKDKNDKLIAIKYERENLHNKITLYENVTMNDDDINILNEEDVSCSKHYYYKYQNGEYTDNNRYELSDRKEYIVTKKSNFFKGDTYLFEYREEE